MAERLILFASGVALAVLGVFCAFKPAKMTGYARWRHLRGSRFMQKWPFANMITEPWIPTYIRSMGLFVAAVGLTIIVIGIVVNLK